MGAVKDVSCDLTRKSSLQTTSRLAGQGQTGQSVTAQVAPRTVGEINFTFKVKLEIAETNIRSRLSEHCRFSVVSLTETGSPPYIGLVMAHSH